MDSSLKQSALEIVSASPSRKSLLKLIYWLDLELFQASEEKKHFLLQVLTRSVIASGYVLIEKEDFSKDHPVFITLKAAQYFVLMPSEHNHASYQEAATNSYPFGAGDGCYKIPEIGQTGCKPGSGCSSGAGSLDNLGLDNEVVMKAIKKELIPWLEGKEDPVTKRLQ